MPCGNPSSQSIFAYSKAPANKWAASDKRILAVGVKLNYSIWNAGRQEHPLPALQLEPQSNPVFGLALLVTAGSVGWVEKVGNDVVGCTGND